MTFFRLRAGAGTGKIAFCCGFGIAIVAQGKGLRQKNLLQFDAQAVRAQALENARKRLWFDVKAGRDQRLVERQVDGPTVQARFKGKIQKIPAHALRRAPQGQLLEMGHEPLRMADGAA